MEFVYDFEAKDLTKIVRNALKEGYKIRYTEWLDNYEREEGLPSIDYYLDEEDLVTFKEEEDENDIYSILPEANKYGCVELNFVKNNEYICFYHIERSDEYVCNEAYVFINKEEK